MGGLGQDVRFALRGFRRNPGFTAVTIAVLGLGIGASTAMFSIVDAVVLRPLPFGDPDRLVSVGLGATVGRPGRGTASWPTFADWRDQSRSFQAVAAYHGGDYVLHGGSTPELLEGITTTANLFEVLGVAPALGRGFAPGEDQPGRNRVVVLSDRLWRRRFAADPGVVGRSVVLDGQSHVVVGVAPAGFRFPPTEWEGDLWAPAPHGVQDADRGNRKFGGLQVLARLAPGATVAGAQAELDAVKARLAGAHPDDPNEGFLTLAPLHAEIVRDVRPALLTLLAAVGFVLLIACANVANLMLARGTTRRRELAVRTALGAGRGRVVRQLLTESVVLGLLGGALGLVLALWGLKAALPFLPANLPRLRDAGLDGRVLAFNLLVAAGTGVAFGILPALAATGTDVQRSLRQSSATVAGGRGRGRAALLVAEIALCFVLLIGAGLLLRSLARLSAVDPGFTARGLLTATLSLPETRYRDDGERRVFYQRFLERARAAAGDGNVAVAIPSPYTRMSTNFPFTITDRAPPPADRPWRAMTRFISPDYFAVMKIPVLRGRAFTQAEDAAGAPAVAIISESLARKHWPGQDPLGKSLRLGLLNLDVRAIVGVAADIKPRLDASPREEIYVPFAQMPARGLVALVRGPQPGALAQPLAAAIRAVDPDLPMGELKTMEQRLDESLGQRRLNGALLALFAGLALVLAVVGIYGVMSYTVAQRTRELGVRLALGARGGQVLAGIVGQGARVAGLGLLIGLGAALALTRVLGSQLYGISPTDPGTFAGLGVLLLAVALLATLLPARRATRVDPMIALRSE